MAGAIIAIDQARPGPSTSFGVPGVARNDLWENRVVTLRSTQGGNSSYSWIMLAKPPGSVATLSGETTATATFTPDLPGSYRVQLITNGGGTGNVQVLIAAIRYDNVGTLVNRGWRNPAFGEVPAEDNFSGQTRGWAEAMEYVFADIVATSVFSAAGDLSGNGFSQTVVGIQSVPVVATAPNPGDVMTYGGAHWGPAASAVTGITQLTGDVLAGPGTGSQVATVAKINGTTVGAGGGLLTGQVLRAAGLAAALWGALDLANANAVTGVLPAANQAYQAMGGDVGGTTAVSTISALAVSKLAPSGTNTWILTTAGGVAVWAAPVYPASYAMTGDVTGTTAASVVAKVTGIAGTLAMAATAAALVWAAATTTPSISQAIATAGAGQAMSITAQAAFPTGGGAGGSLTLGGGAGDGAGAHGSVLLKSGPTTTATFASTSITTTIPLKVAAGAGVTADAGVTVTLSGSTALLMGAYNITAGAIWGGACAVTPSVTNYGLYLGSGATILNVETTGTLYFRVNNADTLTVTATGLTLAASKYIAFGTGALPTLGDIRIGQGGGSIYGMHSGGVITTPLFVWDGASNLNIGAAVGTGVTNLALLGDQITAYTGSGFQYYDGGAIYFRGGAHGSSVLLDFTSEPNPKLTIGAAMVSWKVSQADTTVLNATGATSTYQAQNTTNGTATGGNVVIQSGTGVIASVVTQTSAGALIGKVGTVEGLRVTSAGTTLSGGNVVAILGGNAAGTSYCVTGGGYPGYETSNGAIWILPQGTSRTAANPSISADATSTSFGAASLLYFGTGGINYMRMRNSEFQFGTSYVNAQYVFDFSLAAVFHFGATATVSASIVYDGVATATPGKTLSIIGQPGGTSGVQAGGNLVLGSGAGFGGGAAGKISFKVGAIEGARIDPAFGHGIFGGNAGGTAFAVHIGPYPSFETTDAAIWFAPQGTARIGTNMAFSGNATSSTFRASNTINYVINGTILAAITAGSLAMGTSASTPQYIFDFSTTAVMHFGANATVGAKITYDGVSTATPGKTFTIQGQPGGTSGVQAGGDLVLGSGAGFGGGAAGNVLLNVGGATILSIGPVATIASAVFSAAEAHKSRAIAANYTFDASGADWLLRVDTSAVRTITLPLASSFPGRVVGLVDVTGQAGSQNILLNPATGDSISGYAANVFASLTTGWGWWWYQSDGATTWTRIG